MGPPLILADDISGAAESAAALGVAHAPELHLWPRLPAAMLERPAVVDLDSRYLPADAARARACGALRVVTDKTVVVKKIDSLLRGNIAAEIEPLVADDALVVFTPALPSQRRVVRDGVLWDGDRPLHETSRWTLEKAAPPRQVRDVLTGLPTSRVDLAAVRGGNLPQALEHLVGAVAVCDAESLRDLDLLVAAAINTGLRVRYAGSSDLVRALGPYLSPHQAERTGADKPAAGGVLYVLGTGAPEVLAQLELLAQRAELASFSLEAQELAHLEPGRAVKLARDIVPALAAGTSVALQVRPGQPQLDAAGSDIVAGLARLVRAVTDAVAGPPTALMVTGGQTARAVLDALDAGPLAVEREVHPGAVIMRSSDGRRIATRPGSHGAADSLWLIHQALSSPSIH